MNAEEAAELYRQAEIKELKEAKRILEGHNMVLKGKISELEEELKQATEVALRLHKRICGD